MPSSRKLRDERLRKKKRKRALIYLAAGGTMLIILAAAIGIPAWKNRPDPDRITVQGQPSLEIDQQLIEYGDVKLDTSLSFAVMLTNVGDEPLLITENPYVEVREGC